MSEWTAEDGSVIYYEIYGGRKSEKPVLLLLPGMLGAISNQWRQFIKPLSGNYRVVLMDFRGHGRSQNKANLLSTELLLQDINGLLDYLQVEMLHLAGYSTGGYLGLLLALNQPRRVMTLLMHATKFYWTPDAVAKIHQQLDPDMLAEKVPAYADQLVQEHGARQWRVLVRQSADLVSEIFDKGVSERVLSSVHNPVLVSVGDRDELVPVMEAQRLSRQFEKGELLVLPGVRHPLQTVPQIPLLPMMEAFHQ